MKQRHYQLASDFLAALANGELPDEMLTADMTAWLTTQGTVSKASYQQAVRLLDKMCERPLKYTIHSLTADEDRVIVEAQSEGTLINGETYGNTYLRATPSRRQDRIGGRALQRAGKTAAADEADGDGQVGIKEVR